MNLERRDLPEIMTESPRARGTSVLLLAHLFQSMMAGRALEVVRSSPPVFDRDDFSELLAFVVDMLPSRYAASCHTSLPPVNSKATLEKGQADLLVLDAERAVPTDREVQQVDEDGELLVGDELEQPFLDYAEAAIAGALTRPDAVSSFSLRFDRLLDDHGIPSADTLAMATTVYALSALFTAPTVGAPGMFRQHMLPLAPDPDLPWSHLVADSEWKLLNAGDLSAWILTPPQRLSVGERTLQEALVRGLDRAGWQLDDPSPPWRRPTETDWWERLWELLVVAPRLLPTSLLADLGRGVSLDEIPATGLVPLLEAERAGGTLWRRRWQADGLIGACTEPGVLPILLAALEQGELDTLWLERLVMDGLWAHSDFRRDLQSVLLERLADIPPVPEWLPRVEQGLAGVEIPAAPDIITKDRYADSYRLVCLLIDYGLERSADLIAGGTDSLHRCRVLHRALRALDGNAPDDAVWKDLSELCGKASDGTGGNAPHPLTELAAMLSGKETDGAETTVKYRALEVLKGALVENPLLLYPISGNQGLRVPLLYLVAALSGAEVRIQLLNLFDEPACHKWAEKPEWRQAVIDTLRDPGILPPSKLSDPDRELVIRDLETRWETPTAEPPNAGRPPLVNDETRHDTGLRIQVLDDDGAELEYRQLPMGPDGTYAFELVCQQGADAVHFAVIDERNRTFRCEIPAEPERPVHVELSRTDSDNWNVESGNNLVLVLSEEAEPLPVIPSPLTAPTDQAPAIGDTIRWEVALVIDGTMRSESESNSAFPLTDDKAWPRLRSELIALLAALDRDTDSLSFTVIAFGDHPIEGVNAAEFRPEYLLRVPVPGNERRMVEFRTGDPLAFRPFRREAAESLLAAIEPTSGGDFVDGLSDALSACNDLRWSRNARKLVVVVGDSPGHSIEYPIGDRGDATVRVQDVDLEAAELHRTQVEILTIYHRPPADLEPKTGHGRELLQGVAQQYRRLASIPDYALETGSFEPKDIAKRLTQRDFSIGRGASYARLLAHRSDGERGTGERGVETIPTPPSWPSS